MPVASKTFTDYVTVVDAAWLNDVNTLTYNPESLIAAPALSSTPGSSQMRSFKKGLATENSIYNAIYPSVSNFDVVSSVLNITSGSTMIHAAATSGYVKVDSTVTNGVALFGTGMATVNSSNVWGINTLLQDSATRAVSAATGIGLYNEFDFNVMSPNTSVIGLSVGGNSLSQPTSAIGYNVAPLGTGIKWTHSFYSQDAATDPSTGWAILIGAGSASGTNINSQRLGLMWFDSGSTRQATVLQMDSGYFTIKSTGTLAGVQFQNASLFLDAGKSVTIGGNGVVGSRKTGWTAATGTPTRTTFATSTVTLPQLAEHVKALIDDLISHGLIGT